MCDAIWIKKSDINKVDEVERIALEQYDWLIDCLKYNYCFDNEEQAEIFEQLKNIITK